MLKDFKLERRKDLEDAKKVREKLLAEGEEKRVALRKKLSLDMADARVKAHALLDKNRKLHEEPQRDLTDGLKEAGAKNIALEEDNKLLRLERDACDGFADSGYQAAFLAMESALLQKGISAEVMDIVRPRVGAGGGGPSGDARKKSAVKKEAGDLAGDVVALLSALTCRSRL